MEKVKQTFLVEISLNDVKPKIWREFIVDSDTNLKSFHKIIQIIMGWTNSHLHQFRVGDIIYAEPDEDSMIPSIDYRKVKLSKILKKEKDAFYYDYDFGDGWEHKIVLKKILDSTNRKTPYCISGERHCPLEDSGGSYGYSDILKILKNKNHEEYYETKEWVGEYFNPEEFNIDEINQLLSKKNYGCQEY